MPNIEQALIRAKEKQDADWRNLPPTHSENPVEAVAVICDAFIRDIQEYTSGYPSEHDRSRRVFSQDSKEHYRKLNDDLLRTYPLPIFTGGNTESHHPGASQIRGPFAQSEVFPTNVQNTSLSLAPPQAILTTDMLRVNADQDSANPATQVHDQIQVSSAALIDDLERIRNTMEELICRELPGYPVNAVLEYYIKLFLAPWNEYSHACFEAVKRILSTRLETLIDQHFGNIPTETLRTRVR